MKYKSLIEQRQPCVHKYICAVLASYNHSWKQNNACSESYKMELF